MIRREPTPRCGISAPLACAAALALVALAGPRDAAGAGFERVDPAPLRAFKPFDLGVADGNNDGNLDLFTTNHKFPSRYLAGDGSGGLTEARVPLGLDRKSVV